MELPAGDVAAATLRLRRARGHLDRVIAMLEEGAGCDEVLTQLAAVNRAIARGGYAVVTAGLQACVDEAGALDPERASKMEKLFLSLA